MFGRRKQRERKSIANVRVGKPDIKPETPSHVRGVREGNEPGSLEREGGIYQAEDMAKGTAERSTGVNASARNPIDPRMPNLSPV